MIVHVTLARPASAIAAAAIAAVLSATPPARADAAADLRAAVRRLADARSYTYTDARTGTESHGITTTGRIERGGYTSTSTTAPNAVAVRGATGTSTMTIVTKGDRAAIENGGAWTYVADMSDQERAMVAAVLAIDETPTHTALQLLAGGTTVRAGAGGTYTAEMSQSPATAFAGRHLSDARVTATFTVADGVLTGMTVHITGRASRDGKDSDFDQTQTTTVRDVGRTTADVPAAVRARLGAAGPTTKP